MSNEFFVHTGYPAQSADGDSVDLRAELLAIQSGFDKLPPLSGNADKLVLVNAGASGLTVDTAVSGTGISWTPVLTCVTPGNLTVAYTSQLGIYSRMGRQCTIDFFVQTSTWTHTTASGAIYISGFPIGILGQSHYGTCAFSGFTKASYTQVVPYATNGNILFQGCGQGQPMTQLVITDFPTAGTVILAGQIRVNLAV